VPLLLFLFIKIYVIISLIDFFLYPLQKNRKFYKRNSSVILKFVRDGVGKRYKNYIHNHVLLEHIKDNKEELYKIKKNVQHNEYILKSNCEYV
jgi:hypothetical protein